MKILAIDVGLRENGYVVCEVEGNNILLIEEGDVKSNKEDTMAQRLQSIYLRFNHIIRKLTPQILILERLYSHYKHPTTLALLSQVKGVILLLSAQMNLDVYEFSPTRARKSFLGRGNAYSYQVKRLAENMMGRHLSSKHSADAFSLVMAFLRMQKINSFIKI